MEKIQKQKWKSQFMIVALGQAVSMLGSHGVQFALIWRLAEKTSSPLMLGISGLVAYLPMTLFSPFAGIAADRYNRKIISVFSDMAMGAVALIYAVLPFFFDLPVRTVFVMLCVRGIGSTFQQPAIQSIFPLSIVLMSDVVGAILASIALAVFKIPKLEKTEREEQHFIAEIKEGLQVFKEDKKLFYIVIAEALCLFSGVLKINRKVRVSFIGLFGMGVMSMSCGIIPPTYVGWFFFAGGCICLGASGNVHTIPLTAYMQETISSEKMGRAFSVLTLISSVTMPVGLLFSSPIAEKAGINVWFFISGLCMIILTAGVSIRYSAKCRREKG